MRSFTEKVYAVVRRIPKGSVLTYAEVARRAGNARAYRAVGNILHANHEQGLPLLTTLAHKKETPAHNLL